MKSQANLYGSVHKGLVLIEHTSALSILLHGVISLPDAMLCNNYCFTVIVFLQCTCIPVCLCSYVFPSGYYGFCM